MIAVCGATGAGKSSILNAILDDNIVPTSGMRACTAVVTEIGHHKKKTIDGDVSFLTEQEWREELSVLLDDLVDEDGNFKRSTDLRTDAGVAWSKVHAVYPSIDQMQLAHLSVDQIINRDPKIAKLLGTTKHISAPDSKTFAKEISKYIDSKDQKRGDKKKDKEKKKEKEKDDGPAYWPLIRQVRVWCNAKALSTGAILVDLPGVADANAARNNIAKDYMKKCDCVWILAPITRAVDDKTARDLMGDAFKMQLMMDGNYDANAITFIASKCDDISCSEVIRALNLDDDPELDAIEEEIDRCKTETEEWKVKKAEAEAAAHDVNEQLKHSRDILKEHEEHLKALEAGESFEPKLTAKAGKAKKPTDNASAKSDSDSDSDSESEKEEDEEDEEPKSKKRKNKSSDKQRPTKKRKASVDSDKEDAAMDVDNDDDDFEVEDELTFSDDDEDMDKQDNNSSDSDSDSDSDSEKGSEKGDADEEDDEEEEVTPESLKTSIEEVKQAIKDGRVQLSAFRQQRKDAVDMLATLKKKQNEAQRRKNAFCSLKRSEFSRDVLKEDFRTGLKDLDDAEQEQKNPDTFDPTVNIRDYEAIDLPVFTCSARDYVRIKGQVKGDGDPTCFTKVDDTGIPALQEWCHHLTISSRSRAARNFLTHLNTFAKNVRVFLQGVGEVTEADRLAMRDKWESYAPDEEDRYGIASSDGAWPEYEDYGQEKLYTLPQTKVDLDGEPIGVAPRLRKEFEAVVDNCVEELQERFKEGLEEKCKAGATNAATAAVETSDQFAASMHWGTYRATLRRHGTWRQDLNVELSNPFTRQIASSWSKVFESDLFTSFEQSTMDVIQKLIADVEASAALGLKDRAKGQGELCLEEARVALRKTLDVVSEAMNTQQKEISRCLAPHVQGQLLDGYDRAMEERGRGSVARQKAAFRNFLESIKNEVFDGAADLIMDRLAGAATAVGEALDAALNDLAMKIEVSIAVLWEGVRDDPEQVKTRAEVVETVSEILQQVELWKAAEGMSRAMATYTNA
ncbi:Dynamin family-domain-containing protein [Cerioporus squamosus]|nr:Dynamin family-domain-containing protein [Cerioporus squamosus]